MFQPAINSSGESMDKVMDCFANPVSITSVSNIVISGIRKAILLRSFSCSGKVPLYALHPASSSNDHEAL